MASPQCEDGFTKIANEIVEALYRVNLSAHETRVLWFIFRKTYGFQKKTDRIPLSQFSKATGLDRRLVHRALKKLSSKQMIVIYRDDKKNITYGFQKNYERWQLSSKQMTPPKVSSKEMIKVSSKEIPSKESIQKKECPPEILTLSDLLAQRILQNNPKHTRLSNGNYQKTVQLWAADIEKLHRLDKQTIEDIRVVIEWCQASSFWRGNILSGAKLREKWDQLYPLAIEKKTEQSRPTVTRNMAEIIAKGRGATNAS